MAFFLNFFGKFKRSAQELKSIRCLAVTAVLIALACILKTLTIQPLPTLKIGFAFVAISAIGKACPPNNVPSHRADGLRIRQRRRPVDRFA